ncbi:MAG: HlyD family efflux transporter periplasmic adaptor subunit [Nitrospiraceae bacterium]
MDTPTPQQPTVGGPTQPYPQQDNTHAPNGTGAASYDRSRPIPPTRIRPKEIRAQRNRRLVLMAAIVLLATIGYFAYWVSVDRFWVRTDNAYVTGNLVPVAAQASGIITQVLAEETQFVNRGDIIVRLDEHQAYAALGRARGRLGEEVRRINALFMTRKQLAEKLAARTARLDLAVHDMERYRAAVASGAVSKQIVQNTADKILSYEAEVRETQAELDTLDAQVGGTTVTAHPAVELAKNQLVEAYLEYTRQKIKAPISGYVAKRKAQVGDRVQPGASLLTIVPLDHLWVEANLRETELQHVRPGQSALVNVTLYGTKQTFHGTVEGLVPGSGSAFALLPPDNSTGNFIHIVERVPVRIALPVEELREHPIRPGLSTYTKIDISGEGQSVWTSHATPSTAEYETDVYADELPAADAIAHDVIVANLVVTDEDGPRIAQDMDEQITPMTKPAKKSTKRVNEAVKAFDLDGPLGIERMQSREPGSQSRAEGERMATRRTAPGATRDIAPPAAAAREWRDRQSLDRLQERQDSQLRQPWQGGLDHDDRGTRYDSRDQSALSPRFDSRTH